MTEYPHIDSIYKRHTEGPDKGKFIFGKYSRPEFEYLKDNQWVWTEKIDGTNIRIMYYTQHVPKFGGIDTWEPRLEFGGKTNNAQIPAKLVTHLQDTFFMDKMREVFGPAGEGGKGLDTNVVLYGEGYGAGIQKGGGNYSQDQKFVLFDVKIGRWWLKRDAVEDIASKLEIPVVPIVVSGNFRTAEEWVKPGFHSIFMDMEISLIAEGLVGRPQIELLDRSGKRIITKIKHVDYR